jgi:CRISPR-associated protein Cas1
MPNLYVTEPGALLEKESGRLLVTKDDQVLLAVPATLVENVVIVGGAGVTTPALGFLLDRGIGLVFLTRGGKFRGRLSGELSKNVALRRQQYQRMDEPDFALHLSRAIVAGKVHNCRTVCMRWGRDRENPAAARIAAELAEALREIPRARSREELLGIEGQAARRYFAALREELRQPWSFPGRARRPPPDPVNALLSLVYTLLHESCYAAVEAVGLDPYCGYYHQERYGRTSLALDLMEEFRPVIADSVVLTLLNKRMLAPEDFADGEDGESVCLGREGWRRVAEQYVRRLNTPVRPAGLGRSLSYQKVLEVQARRLRGVIEGEAGEYVPFLVK